MHWKSLFQDQAIYKDTLPCYQLRVAIFLKTTKPTFIVGRTWDLQGGILIQKEEMIDTKGWFIQKVWKWVYLNKMGGNYKVQILVWPF